MFCACTETTARVIGERRLRTLRDLAASPADARTVDLACRAIDRTSSAANAADVPFALIYLRQPDGGMRLAARPASRAGDPARARRGRRRRRDLAGARRRGVGTRGARDRPVRADARGAGRPVAGAAAGGDGAAARRWRPRRATSARSCWASAPRRPFDAEYRRLFELLAAQIGGADRQRAGRRGRAAARPRRWRSSIAPRPTFFSNVSHEFRTPLALMLGPLEDALRRRRAARRGPRAPRGRAPQRLRLLKLVNTLLDFSRIEAGRVQAHLRAGRLGALTAELASVFRSAIESAGLQLVVDCPPLAEPVYVDREMWEKIVLNLLSNAFKFTLDGDIAISLRRDGDTAELDRARHRHRHRRRRSCPTSSSASTASRAPARAATRARGIGLALVHELVRLHGGEVHVESAPGHGTTFTRRDSARHRPSRRRIAASRAASAPAPAGDRVVAGRCVVAEASRWLPAIDRERRGAGAARRPRAPRIVRRRRQRRHARLRRAPARPDQPRRGGRRRHGRARRHPRASRPTCCSPT